MIDGSIEPRRHHHSIGYDASVGVGIGPRHGCGAASMDPPTNPNPAVLHLDRSHRPAHHSIPQQSPLQRGAAGWWVRQASSLLLQSPRSNSPPARRLSPLVQTSPHATPRVTRTPRIELLITTAQPPDADGRGPHSLNNPLPTDWMDFFTHHPHRLHPPLSVVAAGSWKQARSRNDGNSARRRRRSKRGGRACPIDLEQAPIESGQEWRRGGPRRRWAPPPTRPAAVAGALGCGGGGGGDGMRVRPPW